MTRDIDDPRRDFLVRALTLGLFAAPGIGQVLQPVQARGDIPEKLPAGRSIYRLDGDVTVDGRPATLETRIGPNSTIRTGRAGEIIFIVASDAFILRSQSELELGSSDNVIIEGMRILSGRLLSVFGKREKPQTITTTTATIGIRGTGVYVESDPEQTYFCTCYGQVRIAANADPNATLDVVSGHHDKPVYILPSASNGDLIVDAPFINHTDSELSLIETLVGRTPPYAFSGGGYEVPRKRNY